MRRLQHKFQELVVIGVHSAKFVAEKSTDALRQAVARLEIAHPVINDRDHDLWRAYGIRAWPTMVVIDGEGIVRASHEGELPGPTFDLWLERLILHAGRTGRLAGAATSLRDLVLARTAPENAPPLRFPAKVQASIDGQVFVADTGHHRVLELSLDQRRERAIIRRSFGQDPGFEDGPAALARFCAPHGLARWGSDLFVADTGNHAVRVIDLVKGQVRTLAGTGDKAERIVTGRAARDTALRSPWDLCCHRQHILFIAMAGSHQIFQLRDEVELVVHAGSGRELLLDEMRAKSAFNQPSGLCLGRGGLFVADTEASAVRYVPHDPEARVETFVGTGLFAFGDRDGTGLEAELQHPSGITQNDGWLYVADSFNHKIKRLDPLTRETRSLVGTGQAGDRDGSFAVAQLALPEGLSFEPGRRRLFIADTNNHKIRVADLDAREIWTLEIQG